MSCQNSRKKSQISREDAVKLLTLPVKFGKMEAKQRESHENRQQVTCSVLGFHHHSTGGFIHDRRV